MKYFLTILLTLLPVISFAAGPFYIYPSEKGGSSYRWSGGYVKWKYDNGLAGLSKKVPAVPLEKNKSYCKSLTSDPCLVMDKCGVVACVEKAFEIWSDAHLALADKEKTVVNTANVSAFNAGAIDGDADVTLENIDKYMDKAKEEGVVLIVLDVDGSIIDKAAGGEGAKKSILGLSDPLRDKDSNRYEGGTLVLNGLFLDGEKSDDNPEDVTNVKFAATILHEVGHILGLDHSQPQHAVLGSSIDIAQVPEGVTTMYPKLLDIAPPADDAQYDLHVDDVVAISSLYSSGDFDSKFCMIKGSIENEKGVPYQGINVIAYSNEANQMYNDARMFVSGALYPAETKNGDYVLAGIAPCRPYKVIYEAVYDEFQSYKGGINPYDGKFAGPDEKDIKNAVNITTGDYKTDVVTCNPDNLCDEPVLLADYSISSAEAKEVKMDAAPPPPQPGEDKSSGEQKKGWCMSVAGGFAPESGLIVILTLVLLGAARKKYIIF
ncbi:MAG: hypothetical protein HYT75_04390 [Deltaproteobacteria bacterium]|nr:hypothetical protein [Deltaproteobacteria bacterium]MBI2342500.1 hypothetical protein [Deltaproteobacteria bacterium]